MLTVLLTYIVLFGITGILLETCVIIEDNEGLSLLQILWQLIRAVLMGQLFIPMLIKELIEDIRYRRGR